MQTVRGPELPVDHQRHRAIVYEINLHHGAELSGFHAAGPGSQLCNKFLIQRDRDLRGSGVSKARPAPLCRISVQSELGDNENPSPGFLHRAVHLPFSITEDAKTDQFIRHPGDSQAVVTGPESDKNEQSRPDFAGDPLVHCHPGSCDPLNNNPHSTVTDLARFRG